MGCEKSLSGWPGSNCTRKDANSKDQLLSSPVPRKGPPRLAWARGATKAGLETELLFAWSPAGLSLHSYLTEAEISRLSQQEQSTFVMVKDPSSY